MASKEELFKLVEEQKAHILFYENKLKSVVRAYKSIETEKKALEVALTAIAGKYNKAEKETISDESKSTEVELTLTSECSLDQLESLKQAICTLTVENKKKEMAFQQDRKALLDKNEKLQEELERLKASAESTTARSLKKQLVDVEAEREKMLSEHGSIAAEMQQRYARERMHAERMEKQVTELSHRLQEKDDLLQGMETRLKEVGRMEVEIQKLKRKAEATPIEQVLREQLSNMKVLYEEELASIRSRQIFNSSVLNDKDYRIVQTESRVKQLTERAAALERQKVDLENKVEELRRQITLVSSQHQEPKQSIVPTVDSIDLENMANQLKLAAQGVDLYELLGLEKFTSVEQPQRLDNFKPCVEKAVGRCGRPSPEARDCDSCESSQKEVLNLKSLIESLQKKLDALEEVYETSIRSNEHMCEKFRKRIVELEENQEKVCSKIIFDCKTKVAELDEELQKQHLRMMDMAAEKDREIEISKSSLAALYAKGFTSSLLDPLDPPQTSSRLDRRTARLYSSKETNLIEENVLEGQIRSSLEPEDSADLTRNPQRMYLKRSISQFGEARNVFYEQELIKREQEIFELRNMVRLSEMKEQDMEQSMLTKDMQYLQIMETLKEEIRVLEGRLTLERSETNMAYLRNIFVQLINSSSSTSRKHILKAIGAVLNLTHIETKKIDTWNL